jgi:hypothetical protein
MVADCLIHKLDNDIYGGSDLDSANKAPAVKGKPGQPA